MIAEKRAELVALCAGVAPVVHDHVPEEPAPPCLVIQPADPFLQPDPDGETYEHSYVLDFDACLLVRLDDEHGNAAATAELDDMLAELINRVNGQDWWIQDVGQPGALVTTSWIHHGVRATVRTRIYT